MLDYRLDIAPDSLWLISPDSEAARAFPFYMTELGDFRAGPDYYVERDNREGFQLLYTLKGAGVFYTQDQELSLTPGTALLIRCAQRHRYATAAPVWHNRWIHFDGPGTEAYAACINAPGPGGIRHTLLRVSEPELLAADFRVLRRLASESGLGAAAEVSNRLSNLMTLLLAEHLAPDAANPSPAARQQEIIQTAAYMRERCGQPLTLDSLAARARLSKYHFLRLFKERMGETPYEYLTGCRISQAKLLLRTTDLSLDEVAEAVGYLSKSNFIAQFKARTGTTPARYRTESLRMPT